MAKQLGKFKGNTPRLITDDVGKMTFSIDVDPEYRFIMQNLMQDARRLDKDEKQNWWLLYRSIKMHAAWSKMP